MADSDDMYKKSIKQMEDLIKKQSDLGKSTKDIQEQWGYISNEIFKLDGAQFFKNVPKSAKDIKDIAENIKILENGIVSSNDQLAKMISNGKKFSNLQQDISIQLSNQSINAKDKVGYDQKIFEIATKLKNDYTELRTMSDVELKDFVTKIKQQKTLSEIVASSTKTQRESLAMMSEQAGEAVKISQGIDSAKGAAEGLRKSTGETTKQFALFSGLANTVALRMKQQLVPFMLEFDNVVHKVQKDTGIMFTQNSAAFANLTSKSAVFGMSVQQTAEFMGDLGQELQTTDFGVLAGAAESMAAVESATGAVHADVIGITGELMRWGDTSDMVKGKMEAINKDAQLFGLSGKKIMGDINKNLSKMRTMGFTGGEESLEKMAIQANKMKINMDEVFDTTKMARTVEGSVKMAAELQLAGGSFAQINPMQLLSAARKGPEEMQKILSKMGSDIGAFNKDGEYQINPIDADRLQIVSEATGQSLDNLTKMITSNAQQTAKLQPFSGWVDGIADADKDLAKSDIADLMKVGANGKVTLNAESGMAKKMGITDMSQITKESIEAYVKKQKTDATSLDEQAKNNQSLKDSFTNFTNSLMSVFGIFEPVLSVLAKSFEKLGALFSKMPDWGKMTAGFTVIGTLLLSKLAQAGIFKGGFLKNIAGGIKGMFSPKASKAVSEVEDGGAKGGPGGFMKGIAEGLKSYKTVSVADILKFGLALTIVGATIVGFIGGLNAVGGIKSIGELASAAGALIILGGGIWLASKIFGKIDIGDVLKGSIAMALVGGGILLFAEAAKIMTSVNWVKVLEGVGVMALVVLGLTALGVLMSVAGEFLLLGVGALILVGAGMLVASAGLLASAAAFSALSKVDWSSLQDMGSALLSVVPGMLGFGFAAMIFANPLSIFGLLAMTATLSELSSVMNPLAESLTLGSNSVNSFASGLAALSSTSDSLNLSKLKELASISSQLASTNLGTLNSTANAAANTGNGNNGTTLKVEPITINLKLNGRDVQKEIVQATAILK